MVEGLNIGADREGDPTEETPTTEKLVGEKPGKLAVALDHACECDESELAVEE